jgi:predicted aspartyl protease
MKASTIPEANSVGRIKVDVKLANKLDVEKAKAGDIPKDRVRQLTIEGTVDTGASYLVLPAKVAKDLGLPKVGKTKVRYADPRVATRDMVELVELELLGRRGTFRAMLEPNRTTVLLGALVLEDLDLLIDSRRERLYPRDPEGFTAEVE